MLKSLIYKNRSFCVGLVVLLFVGILYVSTGTSIPVTVHDQLDYVVPMSELQAEHLGDDYYPELMGGMPSSAAVVGIPGMALLYVLFSSVFAFSFNLLFCLLVAYWSMYACLVALGVRNWISTLASFMFACLPFYSVYGLSSMGIPLVVYAALRINDGKSIWLSLGLVALYGLFSSFVWAGYAVCLGLVLLTAVLFALRKRKMVFSTLLLLLLLVAIYVFSNFDTIAGTFSSEEISHRAEFNLERAPFSIENALLFFQNGQYHAVSNHWYIMVFMFVLVCLLFVRFVWIKLRDKKRPAKAISKLFYAVVSLLLLAAIIALFEIFYTSNASEKIIALLPENLRSFQIDRFYWLYPTIWYLGAGLSFELLMRIAGRKALSALGIVVIVLVATSTLLLSVPNNNLFKNAKDVIIDRDHASITWEQFYAEDLFKEIVEDLDSRQSNDDSSYKVASIGMHPFVAMHNGMKVIDGYSVDYPLAYKNEFGKIIEPELELSPSLHDYFWRWGSRCYLFSHELGQNYLFGKDSGQHIKDLRLNLAAFKELQGKYILSAVPIDDASSSGLSLIGEYTNDASYYKIWVYEVI